MSRTTWIGIDFGSKTAGTSAICFERANGLHIIQSEKGKDADAFILNWVEVSATSRVFIDAPLSLPKVYVHNEGTDYFYRECDRELGAMSPMFLGGLTARAMKLKAKLQATDIEVLETYPAALIRAFSLQSHYKKDLPSFLTVLHATFKIPHFSQQPTNWHQADAALAWISGHRFLQQNATSIGHTDEGIIII